MLLLLPFAIVFLFLIPRFASVFNFGQELADAVDVCIAPETHSDTSNARQWRKWDLLQTDVLVQS